MSSQTAEPFCPIYREALEAVPWKNAPSAHAGLLFDKFADGWWHDHEWTFSFDKGNRNKKDRDKAEHEKEGYWLKYEFPVRFVASERLLAEACSRQRALLRGVGGKVICLKNIDRFVTGMGREHPLENGFAWHHTLGVPFLPGSSLKGLLAAWLREEADDWDWNMHRWTPESNAARWFGTQGHAGQFMVLDMLPTSPPKISVDVMTPHYGPYHQDGDIPGDWHSPVPISFLTVARGQSWQLGILPAGGVRSLDEATMNSLCDSLLAAIEVCGAGAKTAVGYGRFESDSAAEERFRQQQEEQQQREAAARQLAVEEAEFQASTAGDSEPLQKLKKLQRDQNWTQSAGDQNMISALHEFADKYPQPPQDCLDWIRDLVESIPNYKGVWDQPDDKRGKKKDKPKYQSEKIRELVKKLTSQAD